MRSFLRYWLPLFSYVAAIFLLSSFSRVPLLSSLGIWDKLLHFIEYALLATLTVRMLRATPWPRTQWSAWLMGLLTVALLGALDEIFQGTVPGRSSDIFDFLADVLGGATGGGAYLLLKWFFTRREKAPEVLSVP
ncbi:MAG TPA: VanZ family protein [Myxococcota bacterium]|nr:VanZ family protein [Myxococcota bacterium]